MINQEEFIKELRVGNWVLHEGTITKKQVEPLDFSRMEEFIECYEPILLTPEILGNSGFECDDNFQYSNKECRLTKNANGGFAFWIGLDGGYLADMYYVHQLQNLYFALMGEELEIKL